MTTPADQPRRVRLRVQRRRTWWDRLFRRPARWEDRGVYAVEPWPDADGREDRDPVTTPASPNPQALVESLIGHRVRLTLTDGRQREGTIIGCGPSGFQITSGIGGRMPFHYGEVDAIDDLGAVSP